MKTIQQYLPIVFALIFSLAIFSCNDSESDMQGGIGPEITSINLASDNTPVLVGNGGNMYIIHGTGFTNLQKVYFNDFDTPFNPTLVTGTAIFITMDSDTPYSGEGVPNNVRVVTGHGEATYDFMVAPPLPKLNSFGPVNANAGETFTLYGSYFVDPVVMVGDTEATIVSYTETQIQAVMPADSNGEYVTVETIAGSSTWGTAVGTAIYDDVFYNGWNIPDWNNHEYVNNVAQAYQGTTYIKKTMDGWGNLQGDWNWVENHTQYTGIQFAVKSETNGRLFLIFNGDWDSDSEANAFKTFSTNSSWQIVRFTWAQLGNPAALQNISFKEMSGNTTTYYFDNITYTVD